MKKTQIDLQNETIEKVSAILRKYKSVVAAGIRGSHVDKTNTAFSDIDMIVVFDTDERVSLKQIFDEVAGIKPTLMTLYQLYDKDSLFLFEDGVRLDMTFNKPIEFEKWTLENMLILLDPKNVIKKQLETSKGRVYNPGKPSWDDSEGIFQDWFFWMFRQAYCYALQSTKVPKNTFEKLDTAIESVNLIRNKLLNTLYYIENRRDYLENLNPDIKLKFAKTYPILKVESVIDSILKLVELYEIIIKKYCLKEKLPFPKDKLKTMKKLFLEFDSYL